MPASTCEESHEPDSACVFCGIVRGDVPAHVVSENELALAFLTLHDSALAPGHCLVIPKVHCVGVQDADSDARHAVIDLCHDLAQSVTASDAGSGTNLLSACGPGSDQSVPHWHMHVVPRRAGDGITTWPEHDSAVTEQAHVEAGQRVARVRAGH